jgi:hypothetical protein
VIHHTYWGLTLIVLNVLVGGCFAFLFERVTARA